LVRFGPLSENRNFRLSEWDRSAPLARAHRRPKDLFEATRRAAERENITLSDLMPSALAQAVKEAAWRRRKPKTLEGRGFDSS
jgi:hypothetical protein